MKWPEQLLMMRHGESVYNILRKQKEADPLYQQFIREFNIDPKSISSRALAKAVEEKYSLGMGDHDTPLVDPKCQRGILVGKRLRTLYKGEPPDIIFVSPYLRTMMTFEALKKGWPELKRVKVYEDERIREQEHGLSLNSNDWRVFHALYHEQIKLYKTQAGYWYRFPQGESVPDVRLRVRSWVQTLVDDFAEQRVFMVSHHLTILSVLAHLDRWGAKQFILTDKKNKPDNCSITEYRGNPKLGTNGRFVRTYYNRRFWLHK